MEDYTVGPHTQHVNKPAVLSWHSVPRRDEEAEERKRGVTEPCYGVRRRSDDLHFGITYKTWRKGIKIDEPGLA